MNRREMLRLTCAGAVASVAPGTTEAKDAGQDGDMRTYVYKKAGGCEIKADVYGGRRGGAKRPVIVTIHGGALIQGSRTRIDMGVFGPLFKKGFVVVSIDYRLAPETKLPGIIEDVQDAFRWVREDGPNLFGVDPERVGVQGGSAGGYLTLMSGFCVEPRPRAVAAFYGYGDLVGEWYSEPSPFYREKPLVSKEEAYGAVGERALSEVPKSSNRKPFYLYCRQHGLWPKEVAGFDPETERDKFRPYCPVQNVTPDYPPTMLCHGMKDNDVPYEQSVQMAAELARVGVPHEFMPLQGARHGFGGAKAGDLQNALARTVGFLAHYVAGDEMSARGR